MKLTCVLSKSRCGNSMRLWILLEEGADNSEILSYVEEMIADGRPCKGMPEALFWGYDEPENMPGLIISIYQHI